MPVVRSLILSLLVLLPLGCVGADTALLTLSRDSGEAVPAVYFGIHSHRPLSNILQSPLGFQSWRLWDANVSWAEIEKVKGKPDFSLLDKYVSLAESRGLSILLPLGMTPNWASSRPNEKSAYAAGAAAPPIDINDWSNFVRTVVRRYKGRIQAYEIWNEPNLQNFFSGSVNDLVRLQSSAYAVIKSEDPHALVVGPAPTGSYSIPYFESWLKSGGAAYADIIGYHLYTSHQPPEMLVSFVQAIRSSLKKYGLQNMPVWNTESGWLIGGVDNLVDPVSVGFKKDSKVLTDDESRGYVARAHILAWILGIDRFYWYALDNRAMGLVDIDTAKKKPAAIAYAVTRDWLSGATINFCRRLPDTWQCSLSRNAKSRTEKIIWSVGPRTSIKVEKGQSVLFLDGSSTTFELGGAEVNVGLEPILVK